MKIGEALNLRSDLQSRLQDLHGRIAANALVQEGEEPAESADALLTEAAAVCDRLQRLIAQINLTNSQSKLLAEETVTEALARRDVLGHRQGALRAAITGAAGRDMFRYSRSEIRQEVKVDVADLQKKVDDLAKERRELDVALQAHAWTNDLVE